MLIKAEFFVSQNSTTTWSGVYGFKPEDSIEALELYAVIKLVSLVEEEKLESLGKFFLDELQNYLFVEGKESNLIIRLENAAWKMKSKMDFLLSANPEYNQVGLDIEMAICLFNKSFLYMGVIGESKIFIKREDKVADLSKNLADANMMGFFKTGSITIEENDRLCLVTSLVVDNLVEESLAKLNTFNLNTLKNTSGVSLLLLADEKSPWYISNNDSVDDLNNIKNNEFVQTDNIYNNEDASENLIDLSIEKDFSSKNIQQEVKGSNEIKIQEEDFENENILLKNKESFIKNSKFNSLVKSSLNKAQSNIYNLVNKVSKIALKKKENLGSMEKSEQTTLLVQDKVIQSTPQNQNRIKEKILNLLNIAKLYLKNKIIPFLKSSNKTYVKYLRDFLMYCYKKIITFIKWFKKEFIGGSIEDRRNKFLIDKRRKRNRIILIVLGIIISIFLISAINNRNAELKEQDRQRNVKTQLDNLNSQVEKYRAQINSVSVDQKDKIASEIANLSKTAESLKKENLFTDDILKIQKESLLLSDRLYGVTSLQEVSYVSEIGKIYSDSQLSDFTLVNNTIYALDSGRGAIYKINSTPNSTLTQIADGLKQPKSMYVNVEGNIIFTDSDTSSSIAKLNVADSTIFRFAGLAPAVVGTITNFAIFSGNDALYEIRQNHQQIFKRDKDSSGGYVGGGAIYNPQNPPNWKTDPEFAKAIDIEVPFEIYVLIEGKGIQRYLAGGDNTISSSLFENTTTKDIESLSKATAIDIDDRILAVADPINRRVLIFEIQLNDQKTLLFKNSIVYRGSDNSIFKNIKEVEFDSNSKTLFILDGNSIIRVNL